MTSKLLNLDQKYKSRQISSAACNTTLNNSNLLQGMCRRIFGWHLTCFETLKITLSLLLSETGSGKPFR